MRFLTWLYCLLVLGLVVWLGQLVLRGSRTDARSMLDEAVRHSSGPELDIRRALSELEQALTLAEGGRDEALIEEALLTRAKLLTQTGGLNQARADLERVLTYYRPRSSAIEALLAEVVLESGDVEGALARAQAVIDRDRGEPRAWGVKARALLAIARGHLDQAARQTGIALSEDGFTKGQALMRQIAGLARDDPRRAQLVDRLLERLPGGAREGTGSLLERLDLASDHLALVPEAIAESFRGAFDRELAREYIGLLRDAQRDDLAIDFAFAARSLPNVRDWPTFLTLVMKLFLDNGRAELAAEMISPTFGRYASPDINFYLTWCRALYGAQRWKGLGPVSNLCRATGEPEDRAAANFFLGIAQTRQQLYDEAAVTLMRYVKSPDSQPIPGALAVAWQALAEGYRARGRTNDERSALVERVRIAPERYDGVGAAWERLSELWLEARPPDRGAGFEALTHALRLSPTRRAEIEPRWRELGQAMLDANRIDLAAERERLDLINAALPSATSNAYHIQRHAELLLESGDWSGGTLACIKLLELYPGLLPAIDVYIDCCLNSGDYQIAAQRLAQRVELAGTDAATLARLRALPRSRLDGELLLELVRLDPAQTGRRAAADLLGEQGRAGEALAYLQLIAPGELDHDGCLLAATLAHELGRNDEAYEFLARLPAELDQLALALPLALELGADARDPKHLSSLMRLLEKKVEIDTAPLVASADRMLLAGLPTSAVELCTLLDARPRWRSGPVFARLAQGSLLAGDPAGALDHIERIAAYDESGSAELGRLVAAVDARAWSSLPSRVADLRATKFAADPLRDAALYALGERLLEARELIQEARSGEEPDALWLLLDAAVAGLSGAAAPDDALVGIEPQAPVFGAGGAQPVRDPRPLLVRLVALQHPDWRAWSVADVERSDLAHPAAHWPAYLAARGYTLLERPGEAERVLRLALKGSPTFRPGWELLIESVNAGVRRPDHPRLLAAYEARNKALQVAPTDEAEELLMQARSAERRGEIDAALDLVDAALALDDKRGAALRLHGQLNRARKHWREAIEDFHRALVEAEPSSDSHPVAEMLELLDEAGRANPALLETGAIDRELDFLQKRFDQDPLVALRRARRVLPPEKLGLRTAQALALDRLADFRKRTAGRALDELRLGSSRAWFDFIASFDGDRARAFVEAELVLQPGSIDLWRMLGAAAAEAGDIPSAVTALETAQRMLPDGATARRLAELYGDGGYDIALVRRAVSDASVFERVKQSDARLQWTLARALVRGKVGDLNEGIAILQQLWSAPAAEMAPETRARIGYSLGAALCRRNQPADRTMAREVFNEVAPLISDSTEKRLAESLGRLAPLFQ